jgi:electron transport complex protein RnfB
VNAEFINAGLIDAIDALLPQTQCTKCRYPGCRPYAQALAERAADIDQCPPGGAAGVSKLAKLLGLPEKPLNPSYGIETPRAAAVIDEAHCIGCTLCIEACPVDAIVGAAKRMHTVVTQYCTGCGLCLPPCPVDCIDLVELNTLAQRGNIHAGALASQPVEEMAALARQRFGFREVRVVRQNKERSERMTSRASVLPSELEMRPGDHGMERKKAAIAAAIRRARARRAAFDKR